VNNELDELLDCQKPRQSSDDMHDEHLLIVTHQGEEMTSLLARIAGTACKQY